MHAKFHAQILVDSALHDKFGARFGSKTAPWYPKCCIHGFLLGFCRLLAAPLLIACCWWLLAVSGCLAGWAGGLGGRLAGCCGRAALMLAE